jgi:hypothetical protein
MRLLHLTLVWALAAGPVAIVGSYPANAITSCTCSAITPYGYCTQYGTCHVLMEIAAPGTFIPFRNTKACRRSQALQCDSDTCKVVCDPKQK